MGWQHDTQPHHEGYVVAVELGPDDRWVDMARPENSPPPWEPEPVEFLQVVCTPCGWRSARMYAPVRTSWSLGSIDLPTHPTDPDYYEMAAYHLWRTEHADLLAPANAHPARPQRTQSLASWAKAHGMAPRRDRSHLTVIGGGR